MATTADFRNGLCIEFKNDLYIIVAFQHVKPGKGGAFVRTKLKGVLSKKVIDNTFTAGVRVKTVPLVQKSCQYLYQSPAGVHFMDLSNYELISLPLEQVGDVRFIKEGEKVGLLFRDDRQEALICEFPNTVTLKVTEAELGAKGNTTSQAYKNATVETGAKVQVPLFIKEGDVIKVNPSTGSYLARA